MATETTAEQCHAITSDGERCQREATEDGFCYMHDESDQTVDSYDESSEADDADSSDSNPDEANADAADGDDTDSDTAADDVASGELNGVLDVRRAVESLAPDVIGRELDAVIGVEAVDDAWRAVVEVVERPAVPDSQDIIGRYEIELSDGSVTGFRRVDRYRRSDTTADIPE